MGGSTPEAPRKRMKRAMKQPHIPDQAPPTASDMVDNTMMDILLDMSSWMQAMEVYVAQQNPLTHMGNQGSFLDMSRDRAHLDPATTTSSARVAAGHVGSSGTIALWMTDDIIPEMARRELARCLRQAPVLVDMSTDDSGRDQESARRRKKGKPLKSGKVRTTDSTVIMAT